MHQAYDKHNAQLIGMLRDHWKTLYQVDLDTAVQPLLFRLLSNYLDQGISVMPFPIGNIGFLEAIQQLDNSSFVSIFKTSRAKQLLQSTDLSVEKLLKIVVGDQAYFVQYLFTHIRINQYWLISMMALAFILVEITALRICARVYLGQHKKHTHPIAYRSS